MMTRDHNGWWFVMLAGVLGILASDAEMVRDLAPDAWETQVHAVIKLLSMLLLGGGGWARMSELPISHAGRKKAIQKNAKHADKASVAASVAAVASDEAAKASSIAAEAADVAVEESTKASGIKDD